jgi:hypothetical protein
VAKRLSGRYVSGERGWVKTKNRDYWRYEIERETAIRSAASGESSSRRALPMGRYATDRDSRFARPRADLPAVRPLRSDPALVHSPTSPVQDLSVGASARPIVASSNASPVSKTDLVLHP